MSTADPAYLSRRSSNRSQFFQSQHVLPLPFYAAWQLVEFSPVTYVYEDSNAPYGDVNITPEALFDIFSVARKAPLETFYVNVGTGADGNNGLTPGTAKKSIAAAVTVANTAAVPSQIIVAAGSYDRAQGIYQGGVGVPTVDIAFIASGGIVETGTWDTYGAPTKDATFTNTYSFVLANANRVVDLTQVDRFGNYVELIPVGTNAIANTIPNSWAITAGSIYIQRADGAAVTAANTRVYRANVDNARFNNPLNVFFGVADNSASWDFQGGQLGCVRYIPGSKPAANKAFICRNAKFRFSGGTTNTTGNGVTVDSIHGIAAFWNCQADTNWADGFNFHNALTPTARGYALTVNCGGNDNGRGTAQSNNGWTSHEDVVGMDICGIYKGNRGGSYRSINTSISWLIQPTVIDDFGDIMNGGSIPPTAFRLDNTARYYVTNPQIQLNSAGYRFYLTTGSYAAMDIAIPARHVDYVQAGATLELF